MLFSSIIWTIALKVVLEYVALIVEYVFGDVITLRLLLLNQPIDESSFRLQRT